MQLFKLFLLFLFIGIFIYSCGTESKPTYTVNTSVSPTEGGSIQLSPSGGTYDEGTEVTVTGSPNEDWVFDEWSGTKSSTQNPFTFTVDENINLTGVFSKKTYPLNITFEGEGTVSEQIIQTKSTDYEVGTLVELTPNPSEGWRFSEWSGDVQSTESVIQVTVDSPMNITAVFEKKAYLLTITVEGEGTVEEEVVQTKSTDYDFGIVVELTPIPSEGWEFLEWSGDVESQEEVIEVTIHQETNVTVTFDKPFYLHSNGVTIKCPNTTPGEKGFVDGVEYESVDRELLIQRRDEDSDLTRVCTSLVTDMNHLFYETNFNQHIGNWDVNNVKDMGSIFELSNFNQPVGKWNVSEVENMRFMFSQTPFNQPIGMWDVEKVENMTRMFQNTPFDQSIGEWDVGNVTNMDGMFFGSNFDQPIDDWNVSNVIKMNSMFLESNFNQPLNKWNVSNVTDMSRMFWDTPFNQSLNNWDVSNVELMNSMFRNSLFNQPIQNWDVSSVREMNGMFQFSQFNKPLGEWYVSNVREMIVMFDRSEFNQPIGDWDVSNVRDMNRMFMGSPFNQPIGNWDVGNVRDMNRMFRNSPFNQPIENWNVSNITNMDSMFSSGEFDQPIGDWDVSNVTNMDAMFFNTPFNQKINGWCVSNITTEPEHFSTHSPLTNGNKPVWGTCPDN